MLVSIAPIVDTSPDYAANDVLGSLNPYQLTGIVERHDRFVLIQSVTIRDLDAVAPSINMYFFNAEPEASTFTDNAVLAIHATDWAMCMGALVLDTGDYITPDGNHRLLTQKSIGLELGKTVTGDIWVVLQAQSAQNYATALALNIDINVVPSA